MSWLWRRKPARLGVQAPDGAAIPLAPAMGPASETQANAGAAYPDENEKDLAPVNDDALMPPQAVASVDVARGNARRTARAARTSARWPFLSQARRPHVFILMACALTLVGMAVFLLSAAQPLASFRQQRALLNNHTFFEGITVDGVALGGLTRGEAEDRMRAQTTAANTQLDLRLDAQGVIYQITGAHIPLFRNTQQVLDRAWAIGRQGFPWMLGSDKTPFDVRWEHTRQTKAQGASLQTQITYDVTDVRRAAAALAQEINRQAVNAVIATFDFDTGAFSVTRDVPGASVEEESIARLLTQALDEGRYQAGLILPVKVLLPQVTSVEMQNGFTRLASFMTNTTADDKRNNNIALAARAINGSTVMPGETFSFNAATGERTAHKGYQMAPAIGGGITFDEVGGGVCQVSSTLFNVAAMAGMHIVARSPHAWPSSYIDKGLDATVNWPNLDFAFMNSSSTPVFITARYASRRVEVALHGMRSGPGESIRLETQLVSTLPPPEESLYERDPSLAPGTQREHKAMRTGYEVDTYRVYMRGGVEFRREKLFTSVYPMAQRVIRFN